MLLWELFFDRIPYRGWGAKKISNHVQAGKRENIDFGPNPTRLQQDLSKIIRAGNIIILFFILLEFYN
jgi:hypothetical protein